MVVKEVSNHGTDRRAFPSEPEYGRCLTPIQGILLAIILSIVLWVLIGLFAGGLVQAAGWSKITALV
jgi:hypothetical protein